MIWAKNNRLNNSEVVEFWNWFTKNCQDFGSDFDNTSLLEELDVRIKRLGNFSWEIGPGKTQENSLVISPNGDLELLPFTKKIIASAKNCERWEYYYAKPPKEWEFKFEYSISSGVKLEVDASKWKYVLLRYEDELFQIIIKSLHLTYISHEDKLAIAEIVLDGILGEEMRMQTIAEINLVEDFEILYRNKASNITDLLNHLLTF
jgi:hypothetical protein